MFNFLARVEATGIDIFGKILNFFYELKEIVYPEYVLYGSVALLFLMVFICLIVTNKTYEMKVLNYVKSSNKYFKRNPYIDENNLIYVNNKFKKSPKKIRYAWQQYMLNRDKLPSDYVNTQSCVDQPLRSSSAENTSKILHLTVLIISILGFLLNLVSVLHSEQVGTDSNLSINHNGILAWLYIFTVPLLIYIIGTIVVIILKARHTAVVGDLYTEFQDFERYLNKACSTMPGYIDYEVLFTRKEIREGIPALQDYLEKRALEEQKEREAQEMRKYAFDEYNFEELGLENALLIERAMTESERFFNVKRNLNEKISAKQTEMASYQKNFDEVTKEFEKKAQAYRENLKQLNEQLNSTSVNIEANYIKKRYREDQQKLQQLEKDYEIASIRFNKQQNEINGEVEAYQKEIDRSKSELQRAMTEEGKSYANKVYGIINAKVFEQHKPLFDEQLAEIEGLKKQIDELGLQLKEKENAVKVFEDEQDRLNNDILTKKAELEGIKNLREYLTSPEFQQVVINRKKARKASGIDGMSVEELRDRTATAEEQLRIATAKQEQLQKNEEELKNKLKQLEESERQLKRENQELTENNAVKINQNIDEINENIKEANSSLQKREEELMGKINKTLEKLDEGSVEKKKTVTKKKLSSLMENVNKLKNKKNDDK